MELTQGRLKELLYYDPDTGIFTWVKKAFQTNYNRIGSRYNKQ